MDAQVFVILLLLLLFWSSSDKSLDWKFFSY